MNVPFINLKAQLPKIRSEIEGRFSKIIENTAFVCGKEVQEFEETFSELHGVKCNWIKFWYRWKSHSYAMQRNWQRR
jgi:dTDP-4-amino-4,6-dideoxygalactose transaminase